MAWAWCKAWLQSGHPITHLSRTHQKAGWRGTLGRQMDPVCMEGLVARGFHCAERASSFSIVSGSMVRILERLPSLCCDNVHSKHHSIQNKQRWAHHAFAQRAALCMCVLYQFKGLTYSGSHNSIADAISWNSMQVFFALVVSARRQPTPIPQALWKIFVACQLDWLSDIWRILLMDSLRTASQQAQGELTLQSRQGTWTFVEAY